MMKTIHNYIYEKLHISKNTKINHTFNDFNDWLNELDNYGLTYDEDSSVANNSTVFVSLVDNTDIGFQIISRPNRNAFGISGFRLGKYRDKIPNKFFDDDFWKKGFDVKKISAFIDDYDLNTNNIITLKDKIQSILDVIK